MTRPVAIRGFAVARLLWGTALLLVPQRIAEVSGADGDPPSIDTARILGGRDLVQAVTLLAYPTPVILAAGMAVDALHAVSAYAFALVDRSRRRPALTSAVIATGCAALSATLLLVPTRQVTEPGAVRRDLDAR